MARAKTERPRAKTAVLEELTQGIARLQGFLAQVEDLGREGFPYMDAAKVRTDLQLRESIKKIFGDKSPEWQRYRQHKLSMETPAQTKQSVTFIKDLIASLEDKKLELQGLKPPPSQHESMPPAQPPDSRPHMTLVPPTAAAHVTITPAAHVTPPPSTMSVALTTNLDMTQAAASASPITAPTEPIDSPEPPKPQVSAPTISPASAPQPITVQQAPLHNPAPVPSPQISAVAAPVVQPMAAPPGLAQEPNLIVQPASAPTSLPIQPPRVSSATAEAAPSKETASDPVPRATASIDSTNDSCETVKSLCKRFHLVARQLRLRGEYRPTVAVDDEVDVQDLLHGLLRLHFDDIETDEWMPSYSDGTSRIMLLLDDSRLAVVAKKTRAGLNTKDLAEQLRIDVEHCRTLKRCSTLLCFVYDPEGRIGNPRGLETDLISISDQLTADVYVAPK